MANTKKRLLSLVLSLVMVLSLLPMSAFAAESAAEIKISSAEDLVKLAEADFASIQEANIVLTTNIDMIGCASISPIGGNLPFNGSFNGQGYTIKNLSIAGSKGTNKCTGLFGYVGTKGSITKLGLENVIVSGDVNTGAFAGVLTGSVTRCFVTGRITGMRYTGGIAGMLYGGTIENCWTDTAIHGSRYYGGLVGGPRYDTRYADTHNNWMDYTPLTGPIDGIAMVVRNNLTLGTLTGNRYAGGILGEMANAKTTELAAFEGNVSWIDSAEVRENDPNDFYGPIFARWVKSRTNPEVKYSNLFWDKMSLTGPDPSYTEADSVSYGTLKIKGETAENLGKQSTYEALNWDFENIWIWNDELGHPVLRGQTVPADPADALKYPASLVTTFAGDPKTTRAFTWNTCTEITKSVVQLVAADNYSSEADFTGSNAISITGSSYELLKKDKSSSGKMIHKVNVTGLNPGTTYFYRAGDGNYWSPVYQFTTEAKDADSFTFFSITDTQDQSDTVSNYTPYANTLKHATTKYPDSAFIVHSGDVIQNTSSADYDEVYRVTSKYTTDLPSMVAPGNHELKKDDKYNKGTPDSVYGIDNLKAHYQFPESGLDGYDQTVYSFTYGDAYFAMLNSCVVYPAYSTDADHTDYSAQIEWLKEDMAKNGADKAWKIVVLHHGPYNYGGTLINEANGALVDAMEDLGVNLVLFGHDHVVARSHPMKDGVATEREGTASTDDGIIYYSVGASGIDAPGNASGSQYALKTNSAGTNLYGAITITEDSMTLTTHPTNDGDPLDTITVYKPDAAVKTAPTANELVYNGQAQTLIAAGEASPGVMLYSLDGKTYSKDLPTATDAGTYTVYYKAGGIDHKDTEPQTISVTIAPKDITGATITLDDTALTYNGAEQTKKVVSVTVDGLTVTYTVEGNKGTAAGSYSLTVTGTGNFTGSATAAWTIAALPVYVDPDDGSDIEDESTPLGNCIADKTCPLYDYKDTDPTEWYHDGIHYCVEKGLMLGKTEDSFSPYGTVTRQQVWMILARISGEKPANMAEARIWAMENGVSDGTNPTANVTRQQLATMLFRYAKLMGYDVSVGEDTNILSYTDFFEVSEYAIPALQWSCGAGVVGGYTDGTLRPTNSATRAHAAAMFQRFCEKVVK